VDDKSAMAIGKFFGAQTIVSGALSGLGSGWRMRIRALEVQTAQVQGQYNRNIESSKIIAALAGSPSAAAATSPANSRTAAASPTASTTPAAPATPATPAAKAYKVGDAGPAGGLIFYDKGNNSGGWRYLEAGPVETEFRAVWSVRGTRVENTQEVVGSGKRNTQLIVEKFSKTSGEWDTAAQKCDDLVFGGFDDWFMPSKVELDMMYGNLKRRNLGDFKDDVYLSSSGWNYQVNVQDFSSGGMNAYATNNSYYVRPIRQVVGP
jgi:hypothetical protein